MTEKKEKLPLDARLLSDAIIELNIARHNVSIYPKGHHLVENSLNRAFEFFQSLFELRNEITIAVAKDMLIIDEQSLDRKNPVYREVALSFSDLNIASVTFISGLTKDEIYSFHRFLMDDIQESSKEALQESLRKYNLTHIQIAFIDYSSFGFDEGKTTGRENLWEQYMSRLLEGRLLSGDESEVINGIPPETLARLLNRVEPEPLKEEAYDRVISSYLRRSSERAFSGKDLKKIFDFIDGLRPELKKQFLSSSVKIVSKDMNAVNKALGDISADRVMEMLNVINEQKVAIPDGLKNLLDKFTKLNPDGMEALAPEDGFIADDILLSHDLMDLLGESNSKSFVPDTYQKEIESLMEFDASKAGLKTADKLGDEWSDEHVDREFNHVILELISSELPDILEDKDSEYFVELLKEQSEQFISTGQYAQALKIFIAMESLVKKEKAADIASELIKFYHSQEVISLIIDSLRIMGRNERENALSLCEHYGERIVIPLIDALIEEESQTTRRFFISLISLLGDKAFPEVIRYLDDSRWFVKRNMLFILTEMKNEKAVPNIRRCCHHENPKVSLEAVKNLLNIKDSYGIKALRKHLTSEDRDVVEKAISLSGAFKVSDAVPDLINLLGKKAIIGADFYNKIPVVKALGQIGDPRALETLRDIIGAKSFIFKSALIKLQEEIYGTLKNYPSEKVKDLMVSEKGL
ncbi:MAG: HEAT-like repeat-containing protein [Nitrospirae bacterium]|nr:HEAT-like repeat-containing protein [Nitrospirota bacterium]